MGQQHEFKLRAPAFACDAGREPGVARNVPALVVPALGAFDATPRRRAQKAQRALLPPKALAFDAFRLTLVQCRWHIAANMAAAVESRDPEALHQLRVGLRRLRVALVSFGGEFRTPQLEAIKLRARSLARLLAPARDLDVFMDELFEPAANANGSKDAFALLRARAEAARRRAWNEAVIEVAGPRFRMFMSDLADIVDRGAWPLSGSLGKGASRHVFALDAPARGIAERMLAHRRRQVCKQGRRLESSSVEERHELRISLKKLRYTAEFFAPLFDEPRADKFVGRVSGIQDILGTLNDVAVAKDILENLVSSHLATNGDVSRDISFVAGIIYGWHLQRAAQSWRDAVKRWKKFTGTSEFWI